MNASLVLLSAMPEFSQAILGDATATSSQNKSVISEAVHVFNALNSSAGVVFPRSLFLALTNWKKGKRRQQHDAQEFLVHFLDQLPKAAMTLEICATDHRTCVRCGDQSETVTPMALFDVAITATTVLFIALKGPYLFLQVQGCIDNYMTEERVDYKCHSLSCSV